MKKTLLIGLGGIAGAWLRFGIKGMPLFGTEGILPIHTAVTNLLACFLIGLLASLLLDGRTFGESFRLVLVTGFLGALSTFSTVCRESWNLLVTGHGPTALLYAAGSLLLGYLAVLAGAAIAGAILRLRREKGAS